MKRMKRKQDEQKSAKFAKVRSAEFTSNKIAGLDVRTREEYLGLVESTLGTNHQTCGDQVRRSSSCNSVVFHI